MVKKAAFVIPYFGKMPNYFQLFLNSCSYNANFDWLIFSDDATEYSYPENVHLMKITFEECKKLIQSKFDFAVTLPTPQKLCDYKCAYGYIFSAYLESYDWWGHCDLDQIFGNLESFITDEMMSKYDKIGSIGHLTLYRNTPENNRVFMSTERYREVFTTERGCGFDEWLPGNINEIYLESGCPICLQNFGADVNSYRTTLQTVNYDIRNRCYIKSPINNSIFLWEHGELVQVYEENGKIKHQVYPYVHLQKRAMEDCRSSRTADRFYIVPNCFVDGDFDPAQLLKRSALRGLVNTQFFKVKWKNLKYRLKSDDWKFSNVFK